MGPTQEAVEFEGSLGARLAARLHRPAGTPLGFALFAHCFSCSKDTKAAYRIAGALAARGIAVLRFDFTGLGQSGGDFADTSFSSNLDDLVAAADYLRAEHAAPQILIGHSLGGAAVIAARSRVPEVRAVVTVAAPSEPRHVRKLLSRAAPNLEETGEAEISLGGTPFRIRKAFLDDLETHDLTEDLRALDASLLVLHSPQDTVVGVDHARVIFQAARHPKSFVTLDGADHLLSRSTDGEYAGELIAAWARRYLAGAAPAPPTAPDASGPPEGEVWVEGGAEGFAQRVRVGVHELAADEPRSVGGTDTGPNPYDYVLTALGACTSMTLRLYADRKGWPLESVRVALAHRKIHARDCDDCESTDGRLDEISRTLELGGPLDAEQRARLVEIADRCPVHRTLTSEVKIRTELVD